MKMNYVVDYNKTANFNIDCQKGFTPLCPDELPVAEGHLIVEEVNKDATKAKYRLGSKDAHNPNAIWVATEENPQFSPVKDGGKNVDIHWQKHCCVGTMGFELLDGLPKPEEYDFFVWKGIENNLHPYGACYHDLENTRSTGVIEFLTYKGVDTVIADGIAADYCLRTTALQLKYAGFRVIVNLAACRGVSKETTDKAIEEMIKWKIEIANDSSEIFVLEEGK
jgi:nicotinamidase/pyrazinamidase